MNGEMKVCFDSVYQELFKTEIDIKILVQNFITLLAMCDTETIYEASCTSCIPSCEICVPCDPCYPYETCARCYFIQEIEDLENNIQKHINIEIETDSSLCWFKRTHDKYKLLHNLYMRNYIV